MKCIDLRLINEESFVEEQITRKNFDLENKIIIAEANGCSLINGEYLKNPVIKIWDWADLRVIKETEISESLKISDIELISAILIFKISDEILELSDVGFNCWITWRFFKPKIEVWCSS